LWRQYHGFFIIRPERINTILIRESDEGDSGTNHIRNDKQLALLSARRQSLRKKDVVSRGETTNREASVRPAQDVTENKTAKVFDVTTSTPKTADCCWYRNQEACKKRCREGEMQACSKLRRLGG
jgi:hypothetical protein